MTQGVLVKFSIRKKKGSNTMRILRIIFSDLVNAFLKLKKKGRIKTKLRGIKM